MINLETNTHIPARPGTLFSLFLILSLILGGLFVADLFLGSVRIPVSEILDILLRGEPSRPEWADIVLRFRIPKALTALAAGMALSVSGLMMQTAFRNPLAGPYVLGISAGASLGVALLVLGFAGFFGRGLPGSGSAWAMAAAAWLGSGLILLLILGVSLRVRDIMTILILGILFGSATTAIVSIMQFFSEAASLKTFIIWTMGSLGSVAPAQLRVLMASVIIGLLLVLALSTPLNVMLLGEQYARSLGLNIRAIRFLIFLATSILAGSVTAFCGPIGFIGVAVPHLARMLFRTSDHRILLPGSMLTGGIVLLFSDIASQLPGNDQVLPVNAITALLGIPIVIWVIIRNQKIGYA